MTKPRLGQVRHKPLRQPGAYDIELYVDDEWFKIGYVLDEAAAAKTVQTLNAAFSAVIAEATK